MKKFLAAKELAPYRLSLERLLRYKPHTLGEGEEKLLAMQSEMADTADQVFRQLNNADLKFGTIKNEKRRASRAEPRSFSALLHSPEAQRSARRRSISITSSSPAHENTLAATLAGSMQRDVYYAQARGYAQRRGSGAVSRQRAAGGLRQPDRRRASPFAGAVPLLRAAAAEDEAARHPPLRHLRADPQRAGNAAHLEAGGRSW